MGVLIDALFGRRDPDLAEHLDGRDYLMDQVVIPRFESVPGIGNVDVWGVLLGGVGLFVWRRKRSKAA